MRVVLKVGRLPNKFFFISTLSEWHYSCNKKAKDEWLRLTGELSEKENWALGKFKELMLSKYGFQSPDSYLGEFFYKGNERDIWGKMSQAVGANDCGVLQEIFAVFDKRFKKAWRRRSVLPLSVLRAALRTEAAKAFFAEIVSTFGAGKAQCQNLTVVVLFSPLSGEQPAAGSANLKGNYLTVELPALRPDSWQLAYSVALMGHELGHLLFRQRGGEAIVRKTVGSLRLRQRYPFLPFSTFSILNEAVVSAFAPLGVIGQKYFSEKLAPLFFSKMFRGTAAEKAVRRGLPVSYYSNLEIYFVWKMLAAASEYLKSGRAIDANFVKMVGQMVKELVTR